MSWGLPGEPSFDAPLVWRDPEQGRGTLQGLMGGQHRISWKTSASSSFEWGGWASELEEWEAARVWRLEPGPWGQVEPGPASPPPIPSAEFSFAPCLSSAYLLFLTMTLNFLPSSLPVFLILGVLSSVCGFLSVCSFSGWPAAHELGPEPGTHSFYFF